MAPAAYLRMYVPDELEPALEHIPGPRPGRTMARGTYGVWFESLREDAFVIEQNGRRLVCPRHPRLRMLEGLLAFRHAYPPPIAELLVPEDLARRAAAELNRLHAGRGTTRSHILTSPVHVPLRWFAAFEGPERELPPGGLRYRTPRRSALRRLERVSGILEAVGFDEGTIALLRGLSEWVRTFPADSLLELDYGTVADLFSPAQLATDESAADLAASLAALQRGDLEEAGQHYARVATRWAHAQSLGRAN